MCNVIYPNELVSPLGGNVRGNVCGICALAVSNSISSRSMKRKKFDGEIAEQLRLKAIEWRKREHSTRKKVSQGNQKAILSGTGFGYQEKAEVYAKIYL